MMVYNGQVILDFGDIVFFHLKVHLKQVRSLSNLNLPQVNNNLLLVEPEVVWPKILRNLECFQQYGFLPLKIPDKIQTKKLELEKRNCIWQSTDPSSMSFSSGYSHQVDSDPENSHSFKLTPGEFISVKFPSTEWSLSKSLGLYVQASDAD